ncbi:MAG: hypothetical protein FWD18_01745 [Micrococcales bacterium]|nr:hypothetical protein [Micrococcales bacterium]
MSSTDSGSSTGSGSSRSLFQPSSASVDARGAFRQALRFMVILLVGLTVVGLPVGWFVAGWPGLVGALVGVALALVFSGTTVLSVLRTADAGPARMVTVVMGAWMVKVIIVFVVLLVIAQIDYFDDRARMVLGLVLIAGVVGSAVLDYVAVSRARIPYAGGEGDESPVADGETGGEEDGSDGLGFPR